MTIDDVRKPEGALERSPKAGESAPSGADANRRPKRCWVASRQRGPKAGLGRAFPPAPPQAQPTPYYVSFSSVRLIELSILFKRELFAVFDHCIFGVRRICFYDFNTLGNAFEAAAFAAPRIKRYVEIPFIGFRAAAGVV